MIWLSPCPPAGEAADFDLEELLIEKRRAQEAEKVRRDKEQSAYFDAMYPRRRPILDARAQLAGLAARRSVTDARRQLNETVIDKRARVAGA